MTPPKKFEIFSTLTRPILVFVIFTYIFQTKITAKVLALFPFLAGLGTEAVFWEYALGAGVTYHRSSGGGGPARTAAPLALSLSRFLPAKLQFSLHHKCSRSVEGGQGRAGASVAGEHGWRARPRTPRPLPPWWRWPRATATARASEAVAPRAPTRSASARPSPLPTEEYSDSVASDLGGVVARDGAMQGRRCFAGRIFVAAYWKWEHGK